MHVPIHLSCNGQLTGVVVYCTKPDVYTVTDALPTFAGSPTIAYYICKFPTPRTHNGQPYDTWIVEARDVYPSP